MRVFGVSCLVAAVALAGCGSSNPETCVLELEDQTETLAGPQVQAPLAGRLDVTEASLVVEADAPTIGKWLETEAEVWR